MDMKKDSPYILCGVAHPPTPPAMVPYAQVRVVSGLVFSPLHPPCGVIVSVGLGFGVCTVVR